MTRSVLGLLAAVLWLALATAALAGPTNGTTTTTTSTVPGPTTTTTTGPPTTTTTGPPTTTTTTTTAAPTTTTSTSTTTTAAPTTTTTTRPSDLSGERPFLDQVRKTLDEDNQSFSNVDTSSGEYCLAGLVRGFDTAPIPNHEVRFEYRSEGAVKKANAKRVTGDFDVVDLTLIVENSETDEVLYQAMATSACRLKGRVNKFGEQGKTRLKCKLGKDMAALGLDLPANQSFHDSVEAAFPKKNHVKVDVAKGKIRVSHDGAPAPETVEVPLSCDLGGTNGVEQ